VAFPLGGTRAEEAGKCPPQPREATGGQSPLLAVVRPASPTRAESRLATIKFRIIFLSSDWTPSRSNVDARAWRRLEPTQRGSQSIPAPAPTASYSGTPSPRLRIAAARSCAECRRNSATSASAPRVALQSRSWATFVMCSTGASRWRRASTDGPRRATVWRDQVDRFFQALTDFDDYLASDRELGFPITQLLQGPVADSFTHAGQIAMLRRLAGSPVKDENYAKANITRGVVGAEQPPAEPEFD